MHSFEKIFSHKIHIFLFALIGIISLGFFAQTLEAFGNLSPEDYGSPYIETVRVKNYGYGHVEVEGKTKQADPNGYVYPVTVRLEYGTSANGTCSDVKWNGFAHYQPTMSGPGSFSITLSGKYDLKQSGATNCFAFHGLSSSNNNTNTNGSVLSLANIISYTVPVWPEPNIQTDPIAVSYPYPGELKFNSSSTSWYATPVRGWFEWSVPTVFKNTQQNCTESELNNSTKKSTPPVGPASVMPFATPPKLLFDADASSTWTNIFSYGEICYRAVMVDDIGRTVYGDIRRRNFYPITPPPVKLQCNDGKDNDSDGFIDYPSDKGCSSVTDDDETDPVGTPPPPPPPPPPPTGGLQVRTDGASATQTTAKLSASISIPADWHYARLWIQYGPKNGESCNDLSKSTTSTVKSAPGGSASFGVSELSPGKTYCYQAVGDDQAGTGTEYGGILSFTTEKPEVIPMLEVATGVKDFYTQNHAIDVYQAILVQTGKTPTKLFFQYKQQGDTTWTSTTGETGFTKVDDVHKWSPGSIASKTYTFKACGTDSAVPPQTKCGSEHTVVIPTGTLNLSLMTSCFPEGGLSIGYQYTGTSTFSECEVLLGGVRTGTKVAAATATKQYGIIKDTPASYPAAYQLECTGFSGGYLYSNTSSVDKACTDSSNLELTHSKECIPMSPFSDSDTGTIKWKAYNGVKYSDCSASTSPKEDTGDKWKGTKANPDSEQSGFTIPFRKSPYSSITLSLTCTRKFDGEKETASKVLNKGICIYPAPEIDLVANPTTVNAGKPTSTVSWNNKNVKNCALSSDPNQNILIADATTTGGDRNIDGSIKVTPTQSIEVTLTCDAVNSSFGSVSDSVFICHNSSVKSDGTGCTTGNIVPVIEEV